MDDNFKNLKMKLNRI